MENVSLQNASVCVCVYIFQPKEKIQRAATFLESL